MAAETPSQDETTYEVLAVQLWRRVARGSQEPELSVAEAAAALGVSTDTVRRRIRTGAIKAAKDIRGQYRIALAIETAPEAVATAARSGEEAVQLRREIEDMRGQLAVTRRHSESLVRELSAAMRAVAETQAELQTLWRQLNAGPISAQMFVEATPGLEAHERNRGADRIQAMILDARTRFRRRRYPWPLVG